MNEDVLIQISSQLKDKRKGQGITLQELANRAEVSKALISQIENNRTIPSLLVLINLIRSLGLDLNIFFDEIAKNSANGKLVVRRKEEYQSFYKEDNNSFVYNRILTKNISGLTLDLVLLYLLPNAKRENMTTTEAFEFKYIIKGEVEYIVGEETHQLKEGDSLFFDGRVPHRSRNIRNEAAQVLVVYFFGEKA
ncbi:XRE family transcriptional regulator [Siphonobacter sp. SORGH_AS_0500]|uniref:helix-turn-helix domain-containing protein n=1 Tax=Siphonobacter sp. SORGH_AS_0500 TaxID=1864824 RepID=UPI0028629D50|nr:XRE family transcriptional regulator [Siphonobacter sp. SORGH_AS_0500]MDR6196476.1 transcriptional regulator with XRE-family HTH domain [Siphonobacter sp. SORGH_AS_0500]